MIPRYFDIHSHLNFKDYDSDRDELIARMSASGVWTVTIGVDLLTSREAVELAEKHENLFASLGVHPADNAEACFDELEFQKLMSSKKVVAIGECGLDYARLPSGADAEKKRQKVEFEKQIEFAVRHKKPLMIHCRDAYEDMLDLLRVKKNEYGDALSGNFHFFTSPVDIAKRCLEIGFSVSFTGPITFGAHYDDVVKYVPLESMMSETDSPFAAPAPYRGRRNEPLYVEEIVKKIAEIKNMENEEVRQTLVGNALRFFKIAT